MDGVVYRDFWPMERRVLCDYILLRKHYTVLTRIHGIVGGRHRARPRGRRDIREAACPAQQSATIKTNAQTFARFYMD